MVTNGLRLLAVAEGSMEGCCGGIAVDDRAQSTPNTCAAFSEEHAEGKEETFTSGLGRCGSGVGDDEDG